MKKTTGTRGWIDRRTLLGTGAAVAATLAAGASLACADEAGASPEDTGWLGEEPEVGEPTETVQTDVLVVGAGTGGFFAACAAAEAGADVLLIEKMEVNAGVRGDLGAVNSRYQVEDGCSIDEQGILFDLYRFSNGNSSYALHRTWYLNSGATLDWYADLVEARGATMWHEAATPDADRTPLAPHWPVGHSPAWPLNDDGSPALSGDVVLGDYLAEHGAAVRYQTAMTKLIVENGQVVGAFATDADGNCIRIDTAKGVILATGGYGRNETMLAELQPETLGYYSLSIAKGGATGDGIKAAMWAGAAMDAEHSSMLFDRCALPPTSLAGPGAEGAMFFNLGSHPWLKVNLEGKRFTNEGSGVYDWILHAGADQPDGTYCTVFDANWPAAAEKMDMHGCARMYPYENGAPSNETVESMTKGVNSLIDAGNMVVADTIEELAEGLGLPVETFAATVERYNELCAAGVDEDFGKEAFRLAPLDTPPFYGVRNSGVLLCTMDGIRIDESARALRADGTAIEGLFVVGNDSGGYFDRSYPNTLTGGAAGRTITFGRIAGQAAAAR